MDEETRRLRDRSLACMITLTLIAVGTFYGISQYIESGDCECPIAGCPCEVDILSCSWACDLANGTQCFEGGTVVEC